jgi:hypothetical protein
MTLLAWLVMAGLLAVVGMDVTHGTAMQIWMGVAGLLWIIVIVRALRHHDQT